MRSQRRLSLQNSVFCFSEKNVGFHEDSEIKKTARQKGAITFALKKLRHGFRLSLNFSNSSFVIRVNLLNP